MGPLPPELVRSPSQRLAWPPEAISSRQQQPFHYPLSDFLPPGYHHMNESTIGKHLKKYKSHIDYKSRIYSFIKSLRVQHIL